MNGPAISWWARQNWTFTALIEIVPTHTFFIHWQQKCISFPNSIDIVHFHLKQTWEGRLGIWFCFYTAQADFRNLPWFSLASAFLPAALACPLPLLCWANLLQPGAKLALFGTFPAPLPPPGNLLSVNGETFWSQTQQQREATNAMCDHGQLDHRSASTAHLHMWNPFEEKKKIEVATIDQCNVANIFRFVWTFVWHLVLKLI